MKSGIVYFTAIMGVFILGGAMLAARPNNPIKAVIDEIAPVKASLPNCETPVRSEKGVVELKPCRNDAIRAAVKKFFM